MQTWGGVDKMDALLAHYRMFFRSKKWYHRIFFHFVDVALCNSWLLYKRDFVKDVRTDQPMSLYEFKCEVSYCLRYQNKPVTRSVGRPKSQANITPVVRATKRKLPPIPVRTDQVGHFTVGLTKRGYCNNVGCKGYIKFYCIKCKVYLCIGNNKDCFNEFHGVAIDLIDLPH